MRFTPLPGTDKVCLVEDYEFEGGIHLLGTEYESFSIIIPAGFVSDGASIPDFLHSIVGANFHPRFILAALIHDYLYATGIGTKDMADKIFYLLLLEAGVEKKKARIMHQAVRKFGEGNY